MLTGAEETLTWRAVLRTGTPPMLSSTVRLAVLVTSTCVCTPSADNPSARSLTWFSMPPRMG